MSKDKDLLSRFGANLAESMGAGRTPRAEREQTAVAGAGRHAGVTRLRTGAEIEVGRIAPDPNQPRTEFDPEAIERLAESLKSHGQLQPISVRWSDAVGKYLIVTGERRWRAATAAGRPTVTAVIVEGEHTESQILELQLIENCLREDLQPIEQARAYKRLMDRNGWPALRLAETLKLNCATVTRALALLDLPAPVQRRVEAGELAPSVAYEISKIDDPNRQEDLAARVVTEGLSRSETVEAVRRSSGRSIKGKGRGGAKARRETSRVFRTADGVKITVECRKGITPEALRSAADHLFSAAGADSVASDSVAA